jgi:hypothetical protein
VLQKIRSSRQRGELNALTQSHSDLFKTFLEVFNSLRRVFDEMSRMEEFSSYFKNDFNIINYLIDTLGILNIPKEKTDRDNIITKYFVYFTSNFKKQFPGINSKFASDWIKKVR